MTERMKDIVYRDRLGRDMVITELADCLCGHRAHVGRKCVRTCGCLYYRPEEPSDAA